MIRAIIFDCFGVLATDGWLAFSRVHFKNDVERAYARDLLRQHDTGLISAEDFGKKVAEMTGETAKDIEQVVTMHNTKNQQLLDFILQLKPRGFKIGLLSNVGEDWLGHFLSDDERGMFDDILLSYKVGLTKPDPLIYMMSADRLGVLAPECVFVDDRQVCVDGATAVGMHGIHYETYEKFLVAVEGAITSAI